VWPLYCVGHFALKIADVPLYSCTRPASEGCAPDLRDAAKVGQWHFEFPLRIYRFGADSQSQGVDFLPLSNRCSSTSSNSARSRPRRSSALAYCGGPWSLIKTKQGGSKAGLAGARFQLSGVS
jgi:hypothetical protein